MTQRADIRALAEAALEHDRAATPAPWVRQRVADGPAPNFVVSEPSIGESAVVVDRISSVFDADFIAAARDREPELARFALAVLDALEEMDAWFTKTQIDAVRAYITRSMEARRGR